ncbi:MAG: hypothetical protein GX413_02150 [Acetobacter sp.]|nr:hypothetical protein [Acetobacter sp.]
MSVRVRKWAGGFLACLLVLVGLLSFVSPATAMIMQSSDKASMSMEHCCPSGLHAADAQLDKSCNIGTKSVKHHEMPCCHVSAITSVLAIMNDGVPDMVPVYTSSAFAQIHGDIIIGRASGPLLRPPKNGMFATDM